MMTSYIVEARSQGHDILKDNIPTIFEIQDYIEHAWDLGIHSQSREETGGIKGTRKYIGTPDVRQWLCRVSNIMLTVSIGTSNVSQPWNSVSVRGYFEFV